MVHKSDDIPYSDCVCGSCIRWKPDRTERFLQGPSLDFIVLNIHNIVLNIIPVHQVNERTGMSLCSYFLSQVPL